MFPSDTSLFAILAGTAFDAFLSDAPEKMHLLHPHAILTDVIRCIPYRQVLSCVRVTPIAAFPTATFPDAFIAGSCSVGMCLSMAFSSFLSNPSEDAIHL